MTSKIFIIDVEIFCYRLHVLYCVSDKEYTDYMKKVFHGECQRNTNSSATFHMVQEGGYQESIIDFKVKLKKGERQSYELIAHESLHAVFEIAKVAGFKFCENSEEVFAYLSGFVNSRIYTGIFGGGKP
jgi:hypothetical protein